MIVIEIPNGRLGNGLFRYLAALLFRIVYGIDKTQRFLFHEQNRILSSGGPKPQIIKLRDDDFISWCKTLTTKNIPQLGDKILCIFDGYFQVDDYKLYRAQIINYMKSHPEEMIFGTNLKHQLIQNTVGQIMFPSSNVKKYKIVVHVRLEDFLIHNNVIHPNTLHGILTELKNNYPKTPICIISNELTKDIERTYMNYFCDRFPIICESNDVITDFHIMREAEVLVCSLSTLSWCAALLSENIKTAYVPKNKTSAHQLYLRPIENTVVYDNIYCGEKELIDFFAR